MENQVDNKFTWVIENYSDLKYTHNTEVYSDPFSIDGCKWQLMAYIDGNNQDDNFSIFLEVYKHESLPFGWKRCANFSITVVHQISQELSHQSESETQMWFDEESTTSGFSELLPLSKLHEDDSGFLVDEELKIIVHVDVLEVFGELNESEEASQLLKKVDQEIVGVLPSYLLNKTQPLQEGFEFYGFLLFPSQVKSLKRLFESHPDIASEVRKKSQHLRITYINLLLGLIQTMCQSPEELTDDDTKEASAALSYMVSAGFKLDWLEKKLHEVLKKKKTLQSGQSRLPEMEEELLKLNKKTVDHKALLEKEKEEVAAAKISLSFDDFL